MIVKVRQSCKDSFTFISFLYYSGMGYKDTGEQWTAHESKFSELLESLAGGKTNPEDIEIKSLEKKSQSSRARVHYHKFTRGKDLSKYSDKDLANIFGKRKLNDTSKKEDSETEKDDKQDLQKNSVLINGGSMQDYFKKKLSSFANFNNGLSESFGVIVKDSSERDEDVRPTFGFGFKSENHKEEGSSKCNYNKSSFVSYIEENAAKRKGENNFENNILSPNKKMKKGKIQECDNLGLSNPAFNPMATPVKITKHILTTIEEIPEMNDQKMKKDCSYQSQGGKIVKTEVKDNRVEAVNTETNFLQNGTIPDSQIKKKKKKKKYGSMDLGISNPLFEGNIKKSEEQLGIIIKDNEHEVKRTKKSKTKEANFSNDKENENMSDSCVPANNIYDEENVQIDCFNEKGANYYEVKIKEKKKKKKTIQNEQNSLGLANPVFEDNVVEETSENFKTLEQVETRKKKKGKKGTHSETNLSLENSCFSDGPISEKDGNSEENPYEVKRKKKKKASEEDVNKLVESSNNLIINSDINEDNFDLMLNITNEPQLPKSNSVMEKVGSIVKSKRRKSVRFSDVTQEHIIPNNEELRKLEHSHLNGIDNENFDSIQTHVSENLETISKQLDTFQAEIENDINEKKLTSFEEIVVGEIGNPDGENEKLPNSTRLKFKYANLDAKTPMYHLNKIGAKKSYKHLIKGDILLKFRNTNLHEIKGYATTKKKENKNC